MNIYARSGDKVKYLAENGHDDQLIDANKFLEKGMVYTVDKTIVYGWHTDVYLREFPGKAFNSVHFEDYP